MRYAFNLLLRCAVPAILLGACAGKELPDPPASPSRITLIGELIAGDSLHVRAGRSRAFPSAADSEARFDRDMQISCTGAGVTVPLTPYEDDQLYWLFTTLCSSPAVVKEQTEYRIQASAPGMERAEATVRVPASFRGTVREAGPVLRDGDSLYAFDVSMTGLAPDSRYVIEVLRSPLEITSSFYHDGWYRDLKQERALYDSLINAGERVDILRDTSFSNYIERQPFSADRSSAENTAAGVPRAYHWFFLKPEGQAAVRLQLFVPVSARTQSLASNVQVIIRLKSVSPDYYEFLKGYELGNLQPPDQTTIYIRSTAAAGNVKGGLGIVGGVYLQEARFTY